MLIVDQKLSRKTLLCYGLGGFAPTVANEFCGAFLLLFYTELIGLDPIWVGYSLFVRMWVDALVDPAIGWLSDRTHLRSGRRRPYFLIGGLPGSICFLLTFFPPAEGVTLKLVYLTVLSALTAVFLSLNAIPHMALAFELSDDEGDRTRLVGYRSCVESAASLVALLSGPIVLLVQGQVLLGHVMSRGDCYRAAAAFVALLSILASAAAYIGTREQTYSLQETRYRFVQGVKDTLRNRTFRSLLMIYVSLVIANRIVLAQLFLLLEHFHGLKEERTVPLLLSFYLGALVSVPAWIFIGLRWGRNRALIGTIIVWPLTYVFLAAEKWNEGLLCADSFLMGASFSGILTMLAAIAPQALDYDRQTTGLRREGLYASVINLVLQLGLGVGYLAAGVILQLIGFRGGIIPSEGTLIGMRWSVAGFPVLFGFLALLAFAEFIRSKSGQKSHLSINFITR